MMDLEWVDDSSYMLKIPTCQIDKHEPWSLYTVHSDSVTNFMLKTFKKTETYSNIHTYIHTVTANSSQGILNKNV